MPQPPKGSSPIRQHLQALFSNIETNEVWERPDTRIMDGRYLDAITNTNDPFSLAGGTILGSYPFFRGASYDITQEFLFHCANT